MKDFMEAHGIEYETAEHDDTANSVAGLVALLAEGDHGPICSTLGPPW